MQHHPHKKIIKCKKSQAWKVYRFFFSLNAVLCTTEQLHTQCYVGIDILPCDSSQQNSYHTHQTNTDAHHYVCTDVLCDHSTD